MCATPLSDNRTVLVTNMRRVPAVPVGNDPGNICLEAWVCTPPAQDSPLSCEWESTGRM